MKLRVHVFPWWADWLLVFLGAVGFTVLIVTEYAAFEGLRRFLRSALAQNPAVLAVASADSVVTDIVPSDKRETRNN